MAQLQVLNGPSQSKIVSIAGPRFLMGRRRGCHLVLDDGWVSREHAVIIEVRPGEFSVQDLDSENGIFLDDKRVTDSPLRHGAVLRIGRTDLKFLDPPGDGPKEATPAAPTATILEEVSHPPTECIVVEEDGADPFAQTAYDHGSGNRDRADLRERIRRLERLLQGQEDENRRLAMENAVYKRALAGSGLLDIESGRVLPAAGIAAPCGESAVAPRLASFLDPPAAPAPPAARRLAADPLIAGLGQAGGVIARGLHALGHPRVVLVGGEEGFPAGPQGEPASVFALPAPGPGADPVAAAARWLGSPEAGRLASSAGPGLHLLVAGLEDPAGVELAVGLAEALAAERARIRASGIQEAAAGVLLSVQRRGPAADPAPDRAWERFKKLRESGRIGPLWILAGPPAPEGRQPDAFENALFSPGALVVDSFLKALRAAVAVGRLDACLVDRALFAEGLGSFGAGRGPATREGLQQAFLDSIRGGWLGAGIPPTRGREAIIFAGIGSEVPEKEAEQLPKLESLVKEARGSMPRARIMTAWVGFPGKGIAVLTYAGGLALPGRLHDEP